MMMNYVKRLQFYLSKKKTIILMRLFLAVQVSNMFRRAVVTNFMVIVLPPSTVEQGLGHLHYLEK